jgi:hypothetical protein
VKAGEYVHTSLMKKADLVTHLMRRETDRLAKERPTRLERGTMDTLLAVISL